MPTVKHLAAVQNWHGSSDGATDSASETLLVVIADDEGRESLWVGDYGGAPEQHGMPATPGDDRPCFRWMAIPLPQIPGRPAQVHRLGPPPETARIITPDHKGPMQ